MAAFAKNLLNWTSGRFAGSPASVPAPMSLPSAPQPDVPAMVAIAARRQRMMNAPGAPANAGTLLTGPSGVTQPATVQRQTLLG